MAVITLPRRNRGSYSGPLGPAPEWGAVLLYANNALYAQPTGELPQYSVAPGRTGSTTNGSTIFGPSTEFVFGSAIWTEPVLPRTNINATIIVIHRPTAHGSLLTLFSSADYAADDTLFMLCNGDGNNLVRFRDSTYTNQVDLTGSANTLGVAVTVGTIYRWTGEKSLWKNGIKEASTSTNNTAGTFGLRNSTIGALRRTATSFYYQGGISLVAVLPYAVDDDTMRKLMADPWQLIKTEQRNLWFHAGSASIPLVGAACTFAPTSSTGAIVQNYSVVGAGSTIAPTASTAVVTQRYTLAGAGSTIAPTATQAAAVQNYNLLGATSTIVGTITTAAITQTYNLASASTTLTPTSLATSLTQVYTTLAGSGSTIISTASTGGITISGNLAGAVSNIIATSSSGAITQNYISLVGATSTINDTSSTANVVQNHTLTSTASTINPIASVALVSQAYNLLTTSCTFNSMSSTGSITQRYSLTGSVSTIATTSNTGGITQRYSLLPSPSTIQIVSGTGAVTIYGDIDWFGSRLPVTVYVPKPPVLRVYVDKAPPLIVFTYDNLPLVVYFTN